MDLTYYEIKLRGVFYKRMESFSQVCYKNEMKRFCYYFFFFSVVSVNGILYYVIRLP